ncbi:hypothetical protein OAK87_01415 [bacterium]|nr:hypothetical protein [bacterium]
MTTRTPAQSSSLLLNIADQLDHELTFQEIVSFLPSATVEEFMSHLCEVADIEDLMPKQEAA